MRKVRLREFIEVFVPTRDRTGKTLSAARQQEWKDRLARFLLVDLGVTGFQVSMREGVWKQEDREVREYDPRSDRFSVVRERIDVLRTSCTRTQLGTFMRRGEPLLAEMGRALDQEAVAYETREGLTLLFLE